MKGYVRFRGEGSAKRAMDSLMKEHDGKLEIRGVETTLTVVEGKCMRDRDEGRTENVRNISGQTQLYT